MAGQFFYSKITSVDGIIQFDLKNKNETVISLVPFQSDKF